MEFKDFLRRRRLQLGISQADVADRLSSFGEETGHARVGHWETGRNKAPLENDKFRVALAAALEIDVNDMMADLGYIVADESRSGEAKLAASIVDELPADIRQLAIEQLRALQRRFTVQR